ncbi:MAG: hypothetical protein RLZZ596_1895 [Pseudomonadota bacterium]|jgi:tetratricopeptide (TPR) repeat protein
MKLAAPIHLALAKINTALVHGQTEHLADCFTGIDLKQLLSQQTLEEVRARQKTALTLFLATLAVSNDVDPQPAQFWLDCYQSIANKKMSGSLGILDSNNVLRKTLQSLASKEPISHKDALRSTGSPENWRHAFELLIDFRQWNVAITLTKVLQHRKVKPLRWLEIADVLVARTDVYFDFSGNPQIDVDYLALEQMFKLCALAAKNTNSNQVYDGLIILQARSLELAGKHDEAMQLVNTTLNYKNYGSRKIDMARICCKSGKYSTALKHLDDAIANYRHRSAESEDDSAIDSGLKAAVRKDPQFNAGHASIALQHLASICNGKNLKMFLVSGTLLGYAREGKLLDHDKDIDIGLVGWEQQYDICMALQESGLFTISTQFLTGQKSYCIPVRHNPTGVWIDMFLYHRDGDQLVTGLDFFFGYRQTFAFTAFELKPVNFMGVDMYVPENTDLNLQENFGNWRVPDASYLSHLESPSATDKGGQSHMLTARVLALGNLANKKPIKLRKVIQVLNQYADSPWAMKSETLAHMESICQKMEEEQGISSMAVPEMELIHA